MISLQNSLRFVPHFLSQHYREYQGFRLNFSKSSAVIIFCPIWPFLTWATFLEHLTWNWLEPKTTRANLSLSKSQIHTALYLFSFYIFLLQIYTFTHVFFCIAVDYQTAFVGWLIGQAFFKKWVATLNMGWVNGMNKDGSKFSNIENVNGIHLSMATGKVDCSIILSNKKVRSSGPVSLP